MVIGDDLEYRLARLFIFMGYFVRRGCPIYTIGALDQATDLDVMAIRYVEPIRREVLIAECTKRFVQSRRFRITVCHRAGL